MDRESLVSYIEELKEADNASTIDEMVKRTIERRIGRRRPIAISGKERRRVIQLVQKVIAFLEERLCKEPLMNVLTTRQSCDTYMNDLCDQNLEGRFEFLRSRWGFIHCLEYWGCLNVVEIVGEEILKEIDNISTIKERRRPGVEYLPKPGANTSNHDAAYSVLRASAALVSVFWSRRREVDPRAHIVGLVRGMELWFRFIEPEDQINGKPIREWLFSFLSNCTLSLVDERGDFNQARHYCKLAIAHFGEAASIDEQMLEFGRNTCRSFFLNKEDDFFKHSQILLCVLEMLAIQCKKNPGKKQTLNILIELAGKCTIEYGEASTDQCIEFASFFHNLAEKYFSQVPYVASIMEQYALALVVSDYDTYIGWRNPKSSDAVAIPAIVTKLEHHLREFIHIDNNTEFPAFLCDRIATLILSNYEKMIPADENSINLPAIGDFVDRFMELGVSPTCESETTEHMKQVAKIAVTSFMILLITRQDTMGFLDRLEKDGKFQTGVLTNICQWLREVYQTLSISGKVDQAIETLRLCCEAAWKRVLLLSDMLSSNNSGVESGFSSNDRIVDTVNEAAQDSACMLRLIHEHSTKDMLNSTLESYINRWVLAQEKFKTLSPTALVTEWVKIQCQITARENHADYLAPSICSLVPSLRKYEQASCIIIVDELLTYRKMENESQFLKWMENHIKYNIPSSENIIQRFNFLIDGGKQLASLGPNGQLDGIAYITEAVNLLLKCKEGEINVNVGDDFFELLPKAYFLLSLIKRLAYPMQKDYATDIKSGLKLYRETPPKFNDSECALLSCILDMLSLEANVELQSEVYEIMIKSPGKEFLEIALQSGNINHAMCSSPVKDAFLDMVHKHSSSSTGMPYWRTCATSELFEAETYQSLSMLPLLSCLELDADTPKVQETIEIVKRSVSDPEKRFAAAHHYYNLAEIMIAKGLMTEALTFANEGYWLRNKLLLECFTIEWEGETEETNKHVCKTFYPNPSRFSSVGSYSVGKNVPSPWNLLRCYLDSALQKICSIMGKNIFYAEFPRVFSWVLYSFSYEDNMYAVDIFLFISGNVHCKEKCWTSATKELESARKSLNVCSRNLCKKCTLVLEVKLNQLEGDINLSILKNKKEHAQDALRKAKESFERAKLYLENEEWENSVSRPGRETPKENNPVFCYFSEKSDKDCWHCQACIVEKSSSIEDVNNLKWEVIRRRYLLQVVTKLAKLSKLEEDMDEERKLLVTGIYVLVGRSTFGKMELSSKFVEKLVREKVIAQALGAEQASILYKTCRFSLRHEESREKAILSRENVLLGLKMAFVLSREVPEVHEKVSQTLAVVYACSSKDVTLSDTLRATEIQSASYFHQCSVGSLFNSRFLSQGQIQMEVDGSPNLRRVLAPHSVKELEESIPCFFKILSNILPESVTILCTSMFNDKSCGILQKFSPEGHPTYAWLMISRFHLKIGPNVVILPISEKLKAFPFQKDYNTTCEWSCPWAGNKFDQVAPVLRWVLEEDQKLINSCRQNFSKMSKKGMKLDDILGDFLRNLEDSWLGPWKYFLLGKWPGDDNVDTLTMEVDQELKSNFGCYIGKINKTVKKKVPDAYKKKCRDPIVIVSQLDIQMIPFESLPVLQQQEVYRMPSVGSILQSISDNKVFYRNKNPPDPFESLPKQEVYKNPVVNPCNCYYLIKQDDRDFVVLIECFEEWSKTFDMEGKAGNVVKISVDELKKALESHELFLWVGHGDGTQYIPETEIRKIKNCCAVILMGCSSGFIHSRNHGMEGAPLDYLLAGSSVVVANLWSVYTDGIVDFTKKLFETWLELSSSDRIKCEERKLLKRKFTGTSLCEHESNLGSSMAKARAACKRRHLDGATSVIYGIPTEIAETSHFVPEEDTGGGRGKEMKRQCSREDEDDE